MARNVALACPTCREQPVVVVFHRPHARRCWPVAGTINRRSDERSTPRSSSASPPNTLAAHELSVLRWTAHRLEESAAPPPELPLRWKCHSASISLRRNSRVNATEYKVSSELARDSGQTFFSHHHHKKPSCANDFLLPGNSAYMICVRTPKTDPFVGVASVCFCVCCSPTAEGPFVSELRCSHLSRARTVPTSFLLTMRAAFVRCMGLPGPFEREAEVALCAAYLR